MRTIGSSLLSVLLLSALVLVIAAPVAAQQSAQTEASDSKCLVAPSMGDPPPSNGLVTTEFTAVLEPFDSLPSASAPTAGVEEPSGDEISAPLAGWVTIMSEDAEGAFPDANGWGVVDQTSTDGLDFWDDVTCRFYAGSSSIWAAGSGDMTGCSTYDNNMDAWMVYGPFDLSGNVTDAKLEFTFWLKSEAYSDFFGWLASSNGENFSGIQVSGDSSGWQAMSLDLSAYAGEPSVWIAFNFTSDLDVNSYEGAYVDNIILSKHVVDSLEPDIDITPASMSFERSRSTSNAVVQASTADGTDYSQLFAAVEADGQLPVIVRLKTGFVPEGGLDTPLAVGEQRYTIDYAQTQVLADLSGQTVESVKRYQYAPHMALTVDADGLDVLMNSPEVESIVEDVAVPPTLDLSIPLINAEDAWAAGYTGSGQVVAVLDTGVDSSHTFLNGKVVSEACYSSNTTESTSWCPTGQESEIGVGAAVNCDTTISSCKHGTHVAGIAAGDGDSFDGVAPDADIIAIQVFSRFADCSAYGILSPCTLSYTSDQMLGLEYVYALRNSHSIAAANMSLGGGAYSSACDTNPLKATIDNLRSAGIAAVIASGNSENSDAISAPACISSAVSVGATTSQDPVDEVASYSNSAAILDLLAPGSSINSSVPGGGFESWNGTSMATPHVAGAWALLKSQQPDATVDDILYAFTSTGVPILDTRNGLTHPRVDVHAALVAAASEQVLTIHNAGYEDLNVASVSVAEISSAGVTAAGVECDWLLLTPPVTPFSVAPGSTEPVGVGVDVCESAGTYTKIIRIISDDPDEGTVDVSVTLDVAGPLVVTLNWFLAEADGDVVDFQWQTGSETGTAGFHILAKIADGSVAQLNDELIPSSVIDSVAPTRYSFSTVTDATVFFLQEVGVNGSVVMHGPFELSEPSGVYLPQDDEPVSPAIWLPMLMN